jgi:hypothetical protein
MAKVEYPGKFQTCYFHETHKHLWIATDSLLIIFNTKVKQTQ